jgi:hypothetical protein
MLKTLFEKQSGTALNEMCCSPIASSDDVPADRLIPMLSSARAQCSSYLTNLDSASKYVLCFFWFSRLTEYQGSQSAPVGDTSRSPLLFRPRAVERCTSTYAPGCAWGLFLIYLTLLPRKPGSTSGMRRSAIWTRVQAGRKSWSDIPDFILVSFSNHQSSRQTPVS